MSRPWIMLMETKRLRWGGDLRRHHLLLGLARITQGRRQSGWSADAVAGALAGAGGSRPRLASVELLADDALLIASRAADLVAVDLHDEPVSQLTALGYPPSESEAARLRANVEANLAAFRYVIAPSQHFADLAGLSVRQTIIAPNGTDADAIRPGPWPEGHTVAMLAGASPGRGIDELIAACRELRPGRPDLRLVLGLAPTGEESARYADLLRGSVAADPWIEVGPIPYGDVGRALAAARVVVIPHQAGRYMDAALPIKLFDYMASGRPIVTTPRPASAAVVLRHGAGIVAAGDAPGDLAEAIERLLGDEALARRLGAAGRHAAETVYDWRLIGRQLAEVLLRREDRVRWLRRRVAVALARP